MLNSKVKKLIVGGCMLVMAASLVGGCGSSNQPTSINLSLVLMLHLFHLSLKMKNLKIIQVLILN